MICGMEFAAYNYKPLSWMPKEGGGDGMSNFQKHFNITFLKMTLKELIIEKIWKIIVNLDSSWEFWHKLTSYMAYQPKNTKSEKCQIKIP